MRTQQKEKGFTLIELLIVIGIIGFLAAAVLVAVDPVKRIQDSRDARRYSETNAVLNAILTKQVDDRSLYSGMPSAPVVNQTGANVQVIVTSDYGIDCSSATTRPGCNKALDTTAGKNCVANLSNTKTGTGTLASSGTAVTGTGTSFTTEVTVGDTLTGVTSGNTCAVTVVTNNTSITCGVAPSFTSGEDFTITLGTNNSIVPTYIASVPTDPRGTGALCATGCTVNGDLPLGPTNTGYYIARTSGNRVEIGACLPEQSTGGISVKR